MKLYTLRREQSVPFPRDSVFPFFENPENLALITPPDMKFRILTPKPIQMAQGALIDYTVQVGLSPVRWTTYISEYKPPCLFVDVQLKGPYAFWHHTHRFEDGPDGTVVFDEVRYGIPFGILGRLVHALFIRRQLNKIFSYRSKVMVPLIEKFITERKRAIDTEEASSEEARIKMKIVLSGATGFIGEALTEALVEKGYEAVILTRNPESHTGTFESEPVRYVQWDGESSGAWEAELEGSYAVINLAGAPIAGHKWSKAYKKELVDSRLSSTRALVDALRRVTKKPKAFISASAVGYYGDVSEGEVREQASPGEGFLADLCQRWEKEAEAAGQTGMRVAMPRIGIVLEEGGGALEKMLPPFRLFIGGHLGSGKQWFPWVHRDDVVASIIFAMENSAIEGPFNVTAPHPVRMKEFCEVLGKVMKRPSLAPVPGFMLRLLLGEMAEMLLTGQKAVPDKLRKFGYRFKYPDLSQALNVILKG